jgi:predicted solute-binding protein
MIFCTDDSFVVYRFAGHMARVTEKNAYKVMAKDTNYEDLNFYSAENEYEKTVINTTILYLLASDVSLATTTCFGPQWWPSSGCTR